MVSSRQAFPGAVHALPALLGNDAGTMSLLGGIYGELSDDEASAPPPTGLALAGLQAPQTRSEGQEKDGKSSKRDFQELLSDEEDERRPSKRARCVQDEHVDANLALPSFFDLTGGTLKLLLLM